MPGKYWFYIFDDSTGYDIKYFHCNFADMRYDEEARTFIFDTISGSHYVIGLGEKQSEDYKPYTLISWGGASEIIPGDAALEKGEITKFQYDLLWKKC